MFYFGKYTKVFMLLLANYPAAAVANYLSDFRHIPDHSLVLPFLCSQLFNFLFDVS